MSFYFKTLKQTVTEFVEDDALRLSAALAYYSVFSLAPLLIIAIAMAGIFFGEEAVRGQLDDQLKSSLGASGAFAVQDMVANARKPETNLWVSLAGVVMLLVGAGGLFGQLQTALNTVWGVKPQPGRGIRGILRDRFLSFTMVLGTGFLLLTSMILSAVLQAVSTWAGEVASLPPQVWAIISGVASFALIVILFAAIFKVLPDAKVRWRNVWTGAVFTAALFVAGKVAIGWYLGREATASSYGTAGSLALVLLWIYYSSIILLFGAEFTQVWSNVRGDDIQPSEGAVAED
ncbi:YihY/virulence factor BrkB family protein [Luteolibacter flavescens]|uniref:YihY/virulence factor BrkB family protein n=1 Tax=Luteolibacter flavescens TaxID=1859460 RepID=A0ABT3FS15_9BACT|nr:YihY/virulence factor BrkB family protein [Luteolibacter flavescens]MCW1886026.1 YihY/virulence factor BrkB family protein [Luteolibacter flavescens]